MCGLAQSGKWLGNCSGEQKLQSEESLLCGCLRTGDELQRYVAPLETRKERSDRRSRDPRNRGFEQGCQQCWPAPSMTCYPNCYCEDSVSNSTPSPMCRSSSAKLTMPVAVVGVTPMITT